MTDPVPAVTASSLAARGFTPEDAERRAALLTHAETALGRLTPKPARWRWLVPGRVEVFGKHTDYLGGRTLVAALPRGFALAARERQDDLVSVVDGRTDETTTVDLNGEDRLVRGWRSYVAVTARRLVRNFPGAPLGADIAFVSDLPRAAGLSSSSALVVGIATALIQRGALDQREEWLRAVPSIEARAEYLGSVENGYAYGALEGARGVGTEGGSEDHAAILMGEPGHLELFGFAPLRRLHAVAVPAMWSFVVMSSGVHADKAGSVRDRYNRAARAGRFLLHAWNGMADTKHLSLASALASEPEAIDRLRRTLVHVTYPEFATTDLINRLDHFVREDARVPSAAAACSAADAVRLGVLAAASQADAEALLGNQVPETVDLVDAASAAGAYAASTFGAGFGGSAWALVAESEAEKFGRDWMTLYRKHHPHRNEAQWFSARPAPGVVVV